MHMMPDRIRRGDYQSPAGGYDSPLHPQDVDICIVLGLLHLFCNSPFIVCVDYYSRCVKNKEMLEICTSSNENLHIFNAFLTGLLVPLRYNKGGLVKMAKGSD